ncbi:hypothetical protein [Aureibaculum conchae]
MKNEKDLFYVTIANQNAKVKFVFDMNGQSFKKDDLKAIIPQRLIGAF